MLGKNSTPSGKLSASQQITTLGGYVLGIDLFPPTMGTSILRIYDSATPTSDTSKIIAEVWMDAGWIPPHHEYIHPITANKGIYVELDQSASSSTDADYIIRYSVGT